MTTLQTNANGYNADHKNPLQIKSDTGNSYKNTIDSGVQMAEHMYDDAAKVANAAVSDVKSFTGPYVNWVEKEVNSNPVQSIAIAFGVGALLSFFLSRA